MKDEKQSPSRTADRFMIRFTKTGMRQMITDTAEKNGRSMNAEINARLIESFTNDMRGFSSGDLSKEQLQEAFEDAFVPIMEKYLKNMNSKKGK